MRFGIVRNPNARRNRTGKNPAETIRKILRDDDVLIETRVGAGQSIDYAIENAVKVCMQNGVDVICTDGGDGTAHRVLTKVIEVYNLQRLPVPAFCPLNSGTVNFAARGLGISESTPKYLEALVNRWSGETRDIDVLQIDYHGRTMYGFVCALGIVSNFLDEYYNKEKSGFFARETSVRKAAGLISKGIVSLLLGTDFYKRLLLPAPVTFRTRGRDNSYVDPVLLVASAMPVSIVGLKPFHGIADERSELYLLHGNPAPRVILQNIPRALRGQRLHGEGVTLERSDYLEIAVNEDCRFTVDGEMYKGHHQAAIGIVPAQGIRIPKI